MERNSKKDKKMNKARLINITDPNHHNILAEILLEGGVIGTIWGYHLYFLACNACDEKAVGRMNLIKGRSEGQVCVSPGSVEEVEEFADLQKNSALLYAAKKMNMQPLEYIKFLYNKFPIAFEFYAKENTPSTLTFMKPEGKTIWIAGHIGDKIYSSLLSVVRNLRRNGKAIVFAGTSMNIKGDNTLTVKQLDKIIEDFGDKLDAISVYPKASKLRALKYSTSSSVVSFTSRDPKLLRVGNTSVNTIRKYIPGLQIPIQVNKTRKTEMA